MAPSWCISTFVHLDMKTLFTLASLLSLALPLASQAIDGQFPVASNLKVGVAKVDITPTELAGITVVGHRREVTGVRDPLRACVLILDDGETKAAVVTMDTIGAWGGNGEARTRWH